MALTPASPVEPISFDDLFRPPAPVADEPKPLMCATCGSRVSKENMYLHSVADYPIMCAGPFFMRIDGEPERGDWNLDKAMYVVDQRDPAFKPQDETDDE